MGMTLKRRRCCPQQTFILATVLKLENHRPGQQSLTFFLFPLLDDDPGLTDATTFTQSPARAYSA